MRLVEKRFHNVKLQSDFLDLQDLFELMGLFKIHGIFNHFLGISGIFKQIYVIFLDLRDHLVFMVFFDEFFL